MKKSLLTTILTLLLQSGYTQPRFYAIHNRQYPLLELYNVIAIRNTRPVVLNELLRSKGFAFGMEAQDFVYTSCDEDTSYPCMVITTRSQEEPFSLTVYPSNYNTPYFAQLRKQLHPYYYYTNMHEDHYRLSTNNQHLIIVLYNEGDMESIFIYEDNEYRP